MTAPDSHRPAAPVDFATALADLVDPQEFWSKVDTTSVTGCWEWQAGKDRCGYGRYWTGGGYVGAHRIAWSVANNAAIPSGKHVLHRCDNPACVRPMHLFLGTNADNIRDRHQKGRSNAPRGTANGSAKLTPELVLEARELRAAGVSWRVLGERFGVHHAGIRRAVLGLTWKEVA